MSAERRIPAWLHEAVIYQIYPQSFADSDGDGVGDLPGVREKLDYLAWLGVNTLWFNPLFASPFGDAGYDVSDYFTIAPRYGTEDDLRALISDARDRGIRILMDLVPGHTSDQHPWFLASRDDPRDDRYIWAETDPKGWGWVPSPGTRKGFYRQNFFPIQPALNFGYARMDPAEPWRQPIDAPGPRANRAALREIMAHWFDRGVAGFRVDMAFSLVKDDPGSVETGRFWTETRAWIDREYPDGALFAEWGDPKVAVPAGFHSDFFLHFQGAGMQSLWGNGLNGRDPGWEQGPAFAHPDGGGSPAPFVRAWEEAHRAIGGAGFVTLPTANHDISRLVCGPRTRDMIAPAFALLLTWPTLPAIYYGDEIGMRYVPGLPDVEGSRSSPVDDRQGSRTPMQWDAGANAGFSTAAAERLYLPVDPAPDHPTVTAQRATEDSLLHQVRNLIALRKATPALGTAGAVRVLYSGYPFVYLRGDRHLVVVNPRRDPATFTASPDLPAVTRTLAGSGVTVTVTDTDTDTATATTTTDIGADTDTDTSPRFEAAGFSYGVFELDT